MDVQINNICQCCFAEGCDKEMYIEYEWLDQKEIYGDMLSDTFGIKVPNGYICETCILYLRETINFKNKVLETQKCIKTILRTGRRTDAKVVVKKEDSNENYISDVIKIEMFDDDDELNNDVNGSTAEIATVKTENELKMTRKRKADTKRKEKKAVPRKKFKEISDKERPTSSCWEMPLLERKNVVAFLENTTMRPFIYNTFPISYRCLYCLELFKDVHLLLNHVDTHKMRDQKLLLRRVKGKLSVKVDICDLKCKICFAPFDDLNSIRRHLEFEHQVVFTRAGNGLVPFKLSLRDGVLHCHLCDGSFHTFFMLNKHINDHYSNCVCDSCGKSFVSLNRLKQHRLLHSERSVPCTECGKLFANVAKATAHMKRVHLMPKRKSSKCTHCDERFSDHYKKLTHLRLVHNVTFSFRCDSCQKVFKSRKALTLHVTKVHKKNIVCNICGKVFSELTVLKRHMPMHFDEKNFRCPLCDKCYKHEKSLKYHVRSHNPAWTCACANCKEGFSNKYEYKKHIKFANCSKVQFESIICEETSDIFPPEEINFKN